jgi:pantothenate kinase
VPTIGELVDRAGRLATQQRRAVLGIAGAPGSGKSTLARMLAKLVGNAARVVSMDGFHLSRERLAELGRLDRMGAIDTFDVDGFVALVRRLHSASEDTVYAPAFCRDDERVVPNSVAIEPDVRLVIVEGNYLLVPHGGWGALAELLDETWYCERDEDARLADLIARHQQYGKSLTLAQAWALGPDQQNAELVESTRDNSDLIVRVAVGTK